MTSSTSTLLGGSGAGSDFLHHHDIEESDLFVFHGSRLGSSRLLHFRLPAAALLPIILGSLERLRIRQPDIINQECRHEQSGKAHAHPDNDDDTLRSARAVIAPVIVTHSPALRPVPAIPHHEAASPAPRSPQTRSGCHKLSQRACRSPYTGRCAQARYWSRWRLVQRCHGAISPPILDPIPD